MGKSFGGEHPNFEENQELNAFREQGTGNREKKFREQGKEVFGFKKIFLQIWDAPINFFYLLTLNPDLLGGCEGRNK